jgi:hypothetical protein
MFFHWTYLLVIPGIILGFWAQSRVKSAFKEYSQVRSARGLQGNQAARILLDSSGCSDVDIERVPGNLSDHYDPTNKKLRLSEGVYGSDSLAALGIAAHEVGHAVQHAKAYTPFTLRSTLVPAVNLGSKAWFWLFLAGIFFSLPMFTTLGIALFSVAVVFHLVTLPVEFNASSRALALLTENGVLAQSELGGAKKVLNAAGMTYVAALAVAALQLVHLILMSRD